MHAWRAWDSCGPGIGPAIAGLAQAEAEDEAAGEELPVVFGMIGAAAIPHIAGFLSDRSTPTSAANTAYPGSRKSPCGIPVPDRMRRHFDADLNRTQPRIRQSAASRCGP